MRKIALLSYLILLSLQLIFSQSITINYNDYYHFPFSVGVEYQNLSPFADYASVYNIFDLSANLRWLIPIGFRKTLR
ncbi:MAG: hypothetical protein PF693_20230 [Spirochaetia bacterium]|jgi:hypothetical protein|nr:hypothetical protein [Spirochaetia bacterium]